MPWERVHIDDERGIFIGGSPGSSSVLSRNFTWESRGRISLGEQKSLGDGHHRDSKGKAENVAGSTGCVDIEHLAIAVVATGWAGDVGGNSSAA
jgi:hypothetical protein